MTTWTIYNTKIRLHLTCFDSLMLFALGSKGLNTHIFIITSLSTNVVHLDSFFRSLIITNIQIINITQRPDEIIRVIWLYRAHTHTHCPHFSVPLISPLTYRRPQWRLCCFPSCCQLSHGCQQLLLRHKYTYSPSCRHTNTCILSLPFARDADFSPVSPHPHSQSWIKMIWASMYEPSEGSSSLRGVMKGSTCQRRRYQQGDINWSISAAHRLCVPIHAKNVLHSIRLFTPGHNPAMKTSWKSPSDQPWWILTVLIRVMRRERSLRADFEVTQQTEMKNR